MPEPDRPSTERAARVPEGEASSTSAADPLAGAFPFSRLFETEQQQRIWVIDLDLDRIRTLPDGVALATGFARLLSFARPEAVTGLLDEKSLHRARLVVADANSDAWIVLAQCEDTCGEAEGYAARALGARDAGSANLREGVAGVQLLGFGADNFLQLEPPLVLLARRRPAHKDLLDSISVPELGSASVAAVSVQFGNGPPTVPELASISTLRASFEPTRDGGLGIQIVARSASENAAKERAPELRALVTELARSSSNFLGVFFATLVDSVDFEAHGAAIQGAIQIAPKQLQTLAEFSRANLIATVSDVSRSP